MENQSALCRYSVIREKNPREIVLLRGKGCAWRRCRFCDYHLDADTDEQANFVLNRRVLDKVTGEYGRLEVINSGSFVDLDDGTMTRIRDVCRERKIRELHFECHWMHRRQIPPLRESFAREGVRVVIKIGVETFDGLFRESVLDKGIDETAPARIAQGFDECCLLQGLPGQTVQSMTEDIETGLKHFSRVCVNIMQPCGAPVKPDPEVIELFVRGVYPHYRDNQRVDILLENTGFGVGGAANA